MSRFLLHRLLQSLVVLFLMSFVIYWLMGLMPGDPIDLMISADPKITSEDAARLRALYGLDKPITERYLNWLGAAVGGDFGFSRLYAKPVPEALLPALANTVRLLGITLFLSLLIGLPAGMAAAIRPYSKTDYTINLLAFAGISLPAFWLALLLIIVFSVFLGVLPAGGVAALGGDGFWDQAKYLVLPVANLTIASVGGHTRYMRAAMIEALRQDYIRTARAKGAGPARVVLGHALRNALIPVVTIVSLDFGFLFSGALITETVFAYPGMGKLIFDAIMGNDYNLALVALLFVTLLILIGNLLADLAYAWLDPRISYR
ncbi:MAG: ABC transporter permease [Rhodospirillales bacterium]|jgi:peptide/nickel transport system permease protein|nr:ABC transporter permease [Rhodospirillales bacterium]HIJ43112.1 ABC transporter permease [Rhodospirillaceae bacterium]MDP7097485.1 ABC transporter permease [Rhodospirillales bacterium]MDP7214985.1 ABC transporter permease [Rhodospirillales bacterium]HIJ44773.1 ABC transporter permease [Rhodospirillaceae bacterium]